jgi:hypothetical protein
VLFVSTVSRLSRPIFARRRERLGELCRIAAWMFAEAYAEAPHGAWPALIVFVCTFGDLVNFKRYLHLLVADGAYFADGRD